MKLHRFSNRSSWSIDAILAEEDELGLLEDSSIKTGRKSRPADPVVTNFIEIVEFYKKNGREPSSVVSEEKLLAQRLHTYRNKDNLRSRIRQYDTFGLLAQLNCTENEHKQSTPVNPAELTTQAASPLNSSPIPASENKDSAREVKTLDDIFEDDDLGLLDNTSSSIFIRNYTATANKDRAIPDEIARRKICEDFFRYEKLFHDVQKALSSRLVPQLRFSKEETVNVGSVFILKGMLCYIERIIKADTSGAERDNPRMRVIFENGTEADLLKRSFIRALFKDQHGKYVDFGLSLFGADHAHITDKDRITGYIYILSSETDTPELSVWKNAGLLIKIGYSVQEVHERIKNAESDPTYLEAPVKVRAIISCYNLNPQKFERLVHAFLYQQRLNIKLVAKNGRLYQPREWFTVDWQTALEVCKRIIDGSISQYRMDNTTGRIVSKKAAG